MFSTLNMETEAYWAPCKSKTSSYKTETVFLHSTLAQTNNKWLKRTHVHWATHCLEFSWLVCRTVTQQLHVGSSTVILGGVSVWQFHCVSAVSPSGQQGHKSWRWNTKNGTNLDLLPSWNRISGSKALHKSKDFLFFNESGKNVHAWKPEMLMVSCFDSCQCITTTYRCLSWVLTNLRLSSGNNLILF